MFIGRTEVTEEEFEKNKELTKKMYILIEKYKNSNFISAADVCSDIGISYRTYMGLNGSDRYTVIHTLRKIKAFLDKHGLSI